MIRITSGLYGGRKLSVPRAGVRPTQDRVRQAVFSSLGDLEGLTVVDLFAGTGSLGLEALSRGAGRVVWVESGGDAFRILQKNVAALAGDAVAASGCVRSDAFRWMVSGAVRGADLVLADPPYARGDDRSIYERLLEGAAEGGLLRPGGIFVIERGDREGWVDKQGWSTVKDRQYGETRIVMYRREHPIEETHS